MKGEEGERRKQKKKKQNHNGSSEKEEQLFRKGWKMRLGGKSV